MQSFFLRQWGVRSVVGPNTTTEYRKLELRCALQVPCDPYSVHFELILGMLSDGERGDLIALWSTCTKRSSAAMEKERCKHP